MSFGEIIREITEKVDGGIGAVILGYDGIPIDEYVKGDGEGLDIQLLAVEYATLLKEVKRTVEVLRTGEMEEVSIATGRTRILIRAINDDFFLLLVLREDGNFGKGRYLLKRHLPGLRAALQ
jgi:predicted regulator of Ras-like GTPase activity (Roadblock/LC7/MglB family)